MKIKINNITYQVRFNNKISSDNTLGQTFYQSPDSKLKNIILIKKRKGWEQTLFHEIVHIILAEIIENKPHIKRLAERCNNNEYFVNEFSKLIQECMELKK